MVEAHYYSAKHQRGSFYETGSRQTFLKDAIPDFGDKILLFHFNRTLLSNTV